jgi:hypothetical protein
LQTGGVVAELGSPKSTQALAYQGVLNDRHDRHLVCLTTAGLVKGKTIGIDATTLEANAALRSIVRRDSGESYGEFLPMLAKASGI